MSFFRSTVLEFIFLRVCVTSSRHTRIAYASALFHVFLVIKKYDRLCRAFIIHLVNRYSYMGAIDRDNDPHFMEECTSIAIHTTYTRARARIHTHTHIHTQC